MTDNATPKPLSDAAGNEALLYLLGHWSEIGLMRQRQIVAEAADTIERLQKIEQRAQEAFESWGDNEPTFVRNRLHYIWKGSVCIGWEGDQLQGGSDK